eukprot:3647012-Pleurochrysis_carterae.AAC.2
MEFGHAFLTAARKKNELEACAAKFAEVASPSRGQVGTMPSYAAAFSGSDQALTAVKAGAIICHSAK